MKFKRQFDPKYKPYLGIKNTQKSKTIPDQALTVRQVLDRMAKGVDMQDLEKTGSYTEDYEIPQFNDISDFDRWKEDQEYQLKERQKELDKVTKTYKHTKTLIEKQKQQENEQKQLEKDE